MTKIEKLRKKPVEVETMLWDGTAEAVASIKAWVGSVEGSEHAEGFYTPQEAGRPHAELHVAHNSSWSPLPVGYRVARELDGSGFYPLSPEGAAAGYEMPTAEQCRWELVVDESGIGAPPGWYACELPDGHAEAYCRDGSAMWTAEASGARRRDEASHG